MKSIVKYRTEDKLKSEHWVEKRNIHLGAPSRRGQRGHSSDCDMNEN